MENISFKVEIEHSKYLFKENELFVVKLFVSVHLLRKRNKLNVEITASYYAEELKKC